MCDVLENPLDVVPVSESNHAVYPAGLHLLFLLGKELIKIEVLKLEGVGTLWSAGLCGLVRVLLVNAGRIGEYLACDDDVLDERLVLRSCSGRVVREA